MPAIRFDTFVTEVLNLYKPPERGIATYRKMRHGLGRAASPQPQDDPGFRRPGRHPLESRSSRAVDLDRPIPAALDPGGGEHRPDEEVHPVQSLRRPPAGTVGSARRSRMCPASRPDDHRSRALAPGPTVDGVLAGAPALCPGRDGRLHRGPRRRGSTCLGRGLPAGRWHPRNLPSTSQEDPGLGATGPPAQRPGHDPASLASPGSIDLRVPRQSPDVGLGPGFARLQTARQAQGGGARGRASGGSLSRASGTVGRPTPKVPGN